MNVLSLFDGISCGRIALKQAGIPVEKYYASEIDKYATQVSNSHFPEIVRLGDVTKVETAGLDKIDLLIGGSPCQGFSLAKNGRLNFEDERSKLFFDYVRIMKSAKPRHFFLENVDRMDPEVKSRISELMGVEPLAINSNLFSAQNRKRLYWTNIVPPPLPAEGVAPSFQDIIESGEAVRGKCQTILATIYKENAKSMIKRKKWGLLVKEPDGSFRKISVLECERAQNLPDGFTSAASMTQRYKMIGNGWTVGAIAHIFSGLKVKRV